MMSADQQDLVLAIDIGSSSIRALLYGVDGRALPGSTERRDHRFRLEPGGVATDDAPSVLALLASCIDGVLRRAGNASTRIAAVAVDTYAASMVGVDANGQALTPVYTYADTRCADDADALRRELDETAVWERTGCPLRSAYAPARLRWLARSNPALFSRVARWLPLGAYLELTLFGQCRASYSVASWDGLLDRRALTWDAPLCTLLGLSLDQLPPLVDSQAPLQGLLPDYAARWPALSDRPWFPAIGDGAAANIGSGCITSQHMAVTIGTTGALRIVVPQVASVPRGLWCYRVDGRRALLGGATSEGGNLFGWLSRTLTLPAYDELEAALLALPPDSHGLTVLPFLTGERSPGYAGNVRATIHGLDAATTPVEILRAGLEAVAYRCGLIADLLNQAAPAVAGVIASGGALLGSPAWCQILADVLGRPLQLSAEPEATSRGAALLAIEALGLARLADLPARLEASFSPDLAHHAVYRQAMQRQQQLYASLVR